MGKNNQLVIYPNTVFPQTNLLTKQRDCDHLMADGFGAMGDALACCKCGLSKYPEALGLDVYDDLIRRGRVFSPGDEGYEFLSEKAALAEQRVADSYGTYI